MKKFLLILVSFVLLGASALCIESDFKNTLLKVDYIKTGADSYNIQLYTQKPYSEPIKVIKKTDVNYYLLLPETFHSVSSVAPTGDIKSTEVKLFPYAGQDLNNGYTKVNIFTTRPVTIKASLKTTSGALAPQIDNKKLAQLDSAFNTRQAQIQSEQRKAQAAAQRAQAQKEQQAKEAALAQQKAQAQKEAQAKAQAQQAQRQAQLEAQKRAQEAARIQKQKEEALAQQRAEAQKQAVLKQQMAAKQKALEEQRAKELAQKRAQEQKTKQAQKLAQTPKVQPQPKKAPQTVQKPIQKPVQKPALKAQIPAAETAPQKTETETAKEEPAKEVVQSEAPIEQEEVVTQEVETVTEPIPEPTQDKVTFIQKLKHKLSSLKPYYYVALDNMVLVIASLIAFIGIIALLIMSKNKKKTKGADMDDEKILEDTTVESDLEALNEPESENNPLSGKIDEAAAFKNEFSALSEDTAQEAETSYVQTIEEVPEEEPYVEPQVLSSVEIAPYRGFMVVDQEGVKALFGYIYDEVFLLYTFREYIKDTSIKFRISEKQDDKTFFILKVGETKLLVRVTNTTMRLELEM